MCYIKEQRELQSFSLCTESIGQGRSGWPTCSGGADAAGQLHANTRLQEESTLGMPICCFACD